MPVPNRNLVRLTDDQIKAIKHYTQLGPEYFKALSGILDHMETSIAEGMKRDRIAPETGVALADAITDIKVTTALFLQPEIRKEVYRG